MRTTLLALAIAVSLSGCDAKKPGARAPLTDLTTASGLGTVRAAFNAHRGEARFLTLLAPT